VPLKLTRLAAPLKEALFPAGTAPRAIRAGILRGVRMEIDFAGQTQHYLGLYERELYPSVRRLARGARTLLDVGAAEGMYSLYFLARSGVRRVVAFEPSDRRAGLLRNLRLNGLEGDPRFVLRTEFVGAADGPGTVCLDSLLGEVELPCVVKVDVEGAEADVLRGAAELLRRGGTAWVIETHSAALERECLEILREAGHRARVVGNAWWRRWIPEGRPIPHNRWVVSEK
jgi:methyltransferase FkbM-like protein